MAMQVKHEHGSEWYGDAGDERRACHRSSDDGIRKGSDFLVHALPPSAYARWHARRSSSLALLRARLTVQGRLRARSTESAEVSDIVRAAREHTDEFIRRVEKDTGERLPPVTRGVFVQASRRNGRACTARAAL